MPVKCTNVKFNYKIIFKPFDLSDCSTADKLVKMNELLAKIN